MRELVVPAYEDDSTRKGVGMNNIALEQLAALREWCICVCAPK
jgi:hypothetical protein